MAAWYTHYSSLPKKVTGGIRAQNKRGALASTWWGKQWIDTLESFPIGARLARGKSYARSGQVTDLVITSKGVSAKVQGSRSQPYTIKIKLNHYATIQKEALTAKLAAKPLYIAQLLSNEMPESIEQVCKTAKVPLFPEKYYDLETKCTCPDDSNPCKHIAAVIYLMSEAFDRDPFLLFTLRGIDKNAFLKAIGKPQGQKGNKERKEPIAPPEPLPFDHTFWGTTPATEHLIAHALPKVHASIIKRLGPIPLWRSSNNFISLMEFTYIQATLLAENLISHPREEKESASGKTLPMRQG